MPIPDRPVRLIALALWVLFSLSVAWIVGTHVDPAGSDFHGFYNAARVRAGLAISDVQTPPNLSVPILAVLMMPLAPLPLAAAYWTWTALGAVLLAASLWRISQVRNVGSMRFWFAGGALLALMPCLAVWITGQVTWILVWLVTNAWSSTSPRRAGLWLGVAIALKPPLALAAVLLPWPIWSVAAGTSLGLVLLSLPVVGPSAWANWIAAGRAVNWIGQAENVSAWGWAARLTATPGERIGMVDLSRAVIATVLVVALALAPIVRRAEGDRRWGLALLWSLWASPLGWIYYLPLALGPMLSSLRSSWVAWGALIGLLIPWPVTGFPYVFTAYSASVALLWIAWWEPNRRARANGSG